MAIDFERDLLVSVGRETTYNTYISTGHAGLRVLPGARLGFVRSIREGPSARKQAAMSPADMATGLRSWTFDGTLNLPKEALSMLLQGVLGSVTTTSVGTFYKHVHRVNNPGLGTTSNPPSLSLRLLDDNREWQLSGGRVRRLGLNQNLGGFWQCEVSMLGGSFVDAVLGSAPVPTVPVSARHFMISDDFEYKINTAGAANWAPTDWEIVFERTWADGETESYEGGSAERARLESSGFPAVTVTGSTRRIYDGITQFDLFDAYTEFRIEALNKVVSGQNLVAVDTINGYALRLICEKCYLSNWSKESAGGLVMQKLDWRAAWSVTADIDVVLQDSLADPANFGAQ